MVLLDLSVAFDTIDHKVLLDVTAVLPRCRHGPTGTAMFQSNHTQVFITLYQPLILLYMSSHKVQKGAVAQRLEHWTVNQEDWGLSQLGLGNFVQPTLLFFG